jgi:transcription elongation GreA/GreB family factor
MNHKIGDVVEVKLPRGIKKYEIRGIDFTMMSVIC